ncbi:hypothetical protein [Noviherbaspirillum aridicola]|uniref:Uncharacterized protein n=1 Tax=Noviherbaspirillum aridicola TaxID=2849687 RepID=A0ABQ4Q5B0_9BURK|nr:hypothetical protein [Noviherbaspirillum aridicola]GIZ51985.1 hypothetical protein NCCP691_19990 [Noviherbaspirillum aridicola]
MRPWIFNVDNVNYWTIAMAVGMAVILTGMAVMILDVASASGGELVFFVGFALLLAGVIGAARKD